MGYNSNDFEKTVLKNAPFKETIRCFIQDDVLGQDSDIQIIWLVFGDGSPLRNESCYLAKSDSAKITAFVRAVADGLNSENKCFFGDEKVHLLVSAMKFLNEVLAILSQRPDIPGNKKRYSIDDFFSCREEMNLHLLVSMQNSDLGVGELAEMYGCSRETIRRRRNDIEDGFSFLGCRIKAEPSALRSRESSSVSSHERTTAHPIFLTLNLGELYALLKVLCDEEAIFSDYSPSVIRHVSGEIVAQLSKNAKDVLSEALKQDGLGLPKSVLPAFRSDEWNIDEAEVAIVKCLKANYARMKYLNERGNPQVIEGVVRDFDKGDATLVFIPAASEESITVPYSRIFDLQSY